ncbi:hypothetical protein CEXT_252401 [Caerostris extrusa]|uniref:Uncharacterized protein n=1 Tax=Caerostris extrusa TaxID=172846 RepID=A0AAV4SI03_CAEEX|nr:hypothetical protein CEXT_252401 [Caerostris extrusa]
MKERDHDKCFMTEQLHQADHSINNNYPKGASIRAKSSLRLINRTFFNSGNWIHLVKGMFAARQGKVWPLSTGQEVRFDPMSQAGSSVRSNEFSFK